MKILLGREEVNPDKPDMRGLTPLSHAARRGHERMVALLESRKAVTPSIIRFKVERYVFVKITAVPSPLGHATR